jgi:hypothetical protein
MSPTLILLVVVLLTAAVVVAMAGARLADEAGRLRRAVQGLGELQPAVVELRTRGRALRKAMEQRTRT